MAAPVGFPAGNVQLTGYIGPSNLADNYPTHIDVFGKGGFRTCADILERDTISVERRDHGMRVFTKATDELWHLEANLTTWTLLANTATGPEKGGVAWSAGINYQVGDIVYGTDGLFYFANTDHTSVDFVADAAFWNPLSAITETEKGGVAWNAGIDYDLGDIIHDEITQKQYWCNTPNTSGILGGDFASDIAFWTELASDERGGIAWDTTKAYLQGDIVYDVVDDTPYVAIVPVVADQATIPSQNLLEWKAITGTSGSMLTADYRFSTLTAGDPGNGAASVNNADNTLADALFISILDEDGVDRTYGLETLTLGDYVNYRDKGNDPDTYIYRVTAAGINHGTYYEIPVVHHTSVGAGGLADNERMNIEVLYIPHAHEKGGVAWATILDYEIGDIVTIDGIAYICNTAHTPLVGDVIAGDPLQPAQMYWDPIPEVAEIVTFDYMWKIPPEINPAISYCSVSPDIATATTVYMNKDSLSGDISLDIEEIKSGDEITIFATADNLNFVKYTATGDPVLVGNVYEIPATFVSQGGVLADDEPVNFTVKSVETAERGGVAWSTVTDYQLGDITTIDGIAYICNTNHTPLTGDVIAGDPLQPAQMYWDPIPEVSNIVTFDYMWRIPPETLPPISYCSVAPNIPTATTLYMNKDSLAGDISLEIELIKATDEITIYAVADNNNFVKYTATGDPVLVGNVYEIPATFISQGGVLADDEPVSFAVKSIEKTCVCGYVAETGTATYTPTFDTDNFFDYTMTQDTTFVLPTAVEPGQKGTIVVRQDGIGSWADTWAPEYVFPSGLPLLNPNSGWIHIFEYRCISATEIVMEYVSDHGPAMAPFFTVADFAATDTLVNAVVMTWTAASGSPAITYDLYDDTNTLLVSGITSGYSFTYTGTKDFYVKAINSEGTADSNSESGTGVVVTVMVAITDFNATDVETGHVEVTFTEQ